MVEHSTADREVTGSILVAPFQYFFKRTVFFKLYNKWYLFQLRRYLLSVIFKGWFSLVGVISSLMTPTPTPSGASESQP